jgi:hypothetical protein
MPIRVNELTDKQLLEVLAYIEGHFLDLKAKDTKPHKLTKAISAFAMRRAASFILGLRRT